MKCPYCGYTEIKEINKVQQALAGVAATITTFGLLFINPNKGPAIEEERRSIRNYALKESIYVRIPYVINILK